MVPPCGDECLPLLIETKVHSAVFTIWPNSDRVSPRQSKHPLGHQLWIHQPKVDLFGLPQSSSLSLSLSLRLCAAALSWHRVSCCLSVWLTVDSIGPRCSEFHSSFLMKTVPTHSAVKRTNTMLCYILTGQFSFSHANDCCLLNLCSWKDNLLSIISNSYALLECKTVCAHLLKGANNSTAVFTHALYSFLLMRFRGTTEECRVCTLTTRPLTVQPIPGQAPKLTASQRGRWKICRDPELRSTGQPFGMNNMSDLSGGEARGKLLFAVCRSADVVTWERSRTFWSTFRKGIWSFPSSN